MISNKKSSKVISKIVVGITAKSTRQYQNCAIWQLTIEFKCTVLQKN